MTDTPKTILAPTATAAERAIDRANAKTLEALPVNLIRWVKNPDLCPVELLPWLAWEYSVDTWNTNWTEQEKRDAIRRAPFIHRHRGTVAAVRRALVDSPFGTDIVQWFEQTPPGDPYTFMLNVEQKDLPVSALDHQDLKHAVMRAKNLRSWFSVHVFGRKEGSAYSAGYLMATEILTARIFPTLIVLDPPELFITPGSVWIVNVTVLPAKAEDKSFTAVSSDESIATVEVVNGQLVVTGHAEGNVSITVSAVLGHATATLPVVVEAAIDVTMNVADITAPLFWLTTPTEQISVRVDGAAMPVTVDTTGQVFATGTLSAGLHRVTVTDSNTLTFYKSGKTSVNKVMQLHAFCGNRASMYQCFYNQNQLHTIDPGAFIALDGVTNFGAVFYNCTSLSGLPANLFAGKTTITSLSQAFYNCQSLTAAPAGLFDGLVNVLSYQSVFSQCSALAELPAGLFADSQLVTTFSQAFYGCSLLPSIPDDLFASGGRVTSYGSVFNYCSSLASVPPELFYQSPLARDFSNAFANCASLQTISEGQFSQNPEVTDFGSTFNNTGLTFIPAGLFAANQKVTSFATTFALTETITAVPAGLFDACTQATNFNGTFNACTGLTDLPDNLLAATRAQNLASFLSGCTSLVNLPVGLFAGCTMATSLNQAFSGCSALSAIPASLLDDMTSLLSLNQTFQNCSQLTAVPAHLLDNCTLITTAVSTFTSCTKLTDLPDDLFAFQSGITSISGIFTSCTALTSVTGSLFSGLSAVTNVTSAFRQCTSLQQVGDGLFDNCPGITDARTLFYNCTALEHVPDGLLGLSTITMCQEAFYYCRKLVADPNNIMSAESYPLVTATTGLFNNCQLITGSGASLIARFPAVTTSSGALRSCSALDDYASLPTAWK
ncbi:tail protein I [Trabulsiella guamensis ATCC 49490]|uniref:Tail protein I n=1 Tax=Trabulsiella guamensis ATCC 49490 TaxID=1005994 RepID=A0A085ASA6_9ENTR|nr:phage tail protein I [Trabulsiella guamensis]KFC13101.1 tail protein I [Trabulsiella guamensis ATCC 49490]